MEWLSECAERTQAVRASSGRQSVRRMAAMPLPPAARALQAAVQPAPAEREAADAEHACSSAPAAIQPPALPADDQAPPQSADAAMPDRPLGLEVLASGAAGEEPRSAFRRAPRRARAAPVARLAPARHHCSSNPLSVRVLPRSAA